MFCIQSYLISSSRAQILILKFNQQKWFIWEKMKSKTKKYSNPRGVTSILDPNKTYFIRSYIISPSRAQILILKVNQHFGTLKIDLFETWWVPETKKYSNPRGVTSILDPDKTYFIRSYIISSSRTQILILQVNQHFGTLENELFEKRCISKTKKTVMLEVLHQ